MITIEEYNKDVLPYALIGLGTAFIGFVGALCIGSLAAASIMGIFMVQLGEKV